MKKDVIITLLLLILSSYVYSQLINCNPDPSDDPWYAGGISDQVANPEQEIIDAMQQMVIISNTVLPDQVNNSQEVYFPSIMLQQEGICAQASLVYYVFTYEINYSLGNSASGYPNKYQPSFTYNFLNEGIGSKGSSLVFGIEILKESGCPDQQTYGDVTGFYGNENPDYSEWMSGYNAYDTALSKRVTYAEKIDLRGNLDVLRYWIFNHNNNPEQKGGLASLVFENIFGIHYEYITDPDPIYSGKEYIHSVQEYPGNDAHVMTIVGYDEDVACGPYTGALILANSWGTGYGGPSGGGYIYMPYAVIEDEFMLRVDDNDDIWAFAIHVDPDYKADIILRQEIMCNDRSPKSHYVGGHQDLGSATPNPDYKFEYETYDVEDHYPLLGMGTNNDHLEYSLDYQYFLDNKNVDFNMVKSFHYGIHHANGINPAPINLYYLSLIDNRCESPLEIVEISAPEIVDMTVLNSGNYRWLGIDYARLEEYYIADKTIDDNSYVHCQTSISDDATINIAAGTQLYFNDGEIIIEEGCSLVLNGNCGLWAQQGVNKITVYGDLIFNGNPSISCQGGSFEIEYINENLDYTISGNLSGENFNMVSISGVGKSLLVENGTIFKTVIDIEGDLTVKNLIYAEDLKVDLRGGNLEVSGNGNLTNTYIFASEPNTENNTIEIKINNFNNTNTSNRESVIGIDDYAVYSITDNTIHYTDCNGIGLYHAGNKTGLDQRIYSNEIKNIGSPGTNIGIELFFSCAEIEMNKIEANEYGIVAFGKSKTKVLGDFSETNYMETQRFLDNRIHGYFSYSSYPSMFHYNYFDHSSTFNDDPYIKLVYFDIIEEPIPPPDISFVYNIKCNDWHPTFDPEDDLIPFGAYDDSPHWNPGTYCDPETTLVGIIFESALDNIDSSNYTMADSLLKVIVSDYPSDLYALHALNELYSLESEHANNYTNLLHYYQSVITNSQDSILTRTADWMKMHCYIKLELPQNAINWLDSAISVPQNTVDSIFAIINLGYIYTHFPDTTLKSSLATLHSEHIPQSFNHYKVRREELIQHLLKTTSKDQQEPHHQKQITSSITQISPNPTSGSFKLEYELLADGLVCLDIYSVHGSLVQKIAVGDIQKGIHSESLNLGNSPPGMYYVVLKVNDVITDTKKVIVLK